MIIIIRSDNEKAYAKNMEVANVFNLGFVCNECKQLSL